MTVIHVSLTQGSDSVAVSTAADVNELYGGLYSFSTDLKNSINVPMFQSQCVWNIPIVVFVVPM